MDFVDQTREPQTSHLRGRYRPVSRSVIAGAAHPQKPAALLSPVAGLDEVVDYRVNPFGPERASPRSFAPIFKISTSASSCRIRFFALVSSAVSGVLYPWPFASIDLVLAHPFMECGCANPKLDGGGHDGVSLRAQERLLADETRRGMVVA